MSESRPMDRDVARSRWRWVWGAMACVGLAGLGYLLWSAYDHQAVMAWLGELRPLPFFLAMALLPAIGVPITPFFILAGATFGARGGLVGSWIALGLNLTVCYWIARKMRPRFESILRRFGYELPDFRERDKGSVRLTLGIKLAPGMPQFVKNYALGVAGVPFALYLVLSMLVTGIYGALLVVLGESLVDHEVNRALVAVAVLVLLAIVVWMKRRKRRRESLEVQKVR